MRVGAHFGLLLGAALMVGVGSPRAWADELDDHFSGASLPEELKQDFENAMFQGGEYSGQKTGSIDKGRGTFCRKSVDYSIYWQATLGDFHADIDPNSGLIKMHLEFDNSTIDGSGFRKGGILCTYEGGGARVQAQNVSVDFRLQSPPDGGSPDIDVDNVQIHGLTVDRFQLATPIFSTQNGTAPGWLVNAIEGNFNKYMPKFLASSMGARFNEFLSKKLKDYLDQGRAIGFVARE